ncbi:MAG: PspC domain-containing protein [Bacillota bacterium]
MNKKLYRSRTKRTLAGVCGGLEDYFNIDVTIIRLVWVLLTIPGIVFGVLAYVIAAFIIPEEPIEFYDNNTNGFDSGFKQDNQNEQQ